jgi:hypothetical protein
MVQSNPKTISGEPFQDGERSLIRLLLFAQGGYYLVTGVWPLFSSRSFQKVTGPKIDFWLVKTAGLLISTVAGVLLLSAGRQRLTAETALAGIGTAASLAGIDVVYTARRRISPVYLLDAVVQVVFLAGWGWLFGRGYRQWQPGKPKVGRQGAVPFKAAATRPAQVWPFSRERAG